MYNISYTTHTPLKVYLAGQITGLSYAESIGWREQMVEILPDFDFLSPMRAKEYLEAEDILVESYEGKNELKNILSGRKGINARDHWDCSRCDIIFANLMEMDRVSVGTTMEVAWGFAYRKPVIICMEDDNPHQHPMILESATHICPDLETGIQVLRALV